MIEHLLEVIVNDNIVSDDIVVMRNNIHRILRQDVFWGNTGSTGQSAFYALMYTEKLFAKKGAQSEDGADLVGVITMHVNYREPRIEKTVAVINGEERIVERYYR